MARILHADRTEVFKFKESGLSAAIVEACDFIRGLHPDVHLDEDDVWYRRDARGDHYFTFWGV